LYGLPAWQAKRFKGMQTTEPSCVDVSSEEEEVGDQHSVSAVTPVKPTPAKSCEEKVLLTL